MENKFQVILMQKQAEGATDPGDFKGIFGTLVPTHLFPPLTDPVETLKY